MGENGGVKAPQRLSGIDPEFAGEQVADPPVGWQGDTGYLTGALDHVHAPQRGQAQRRPRRRTHDKHMKRTGSGLGHTVA